MVASKINGIELLNKKHLGWKEKIDKDKIKMEWGNPEPFTGCGCILTQIYGLYAKGLLEVCPDYKEKGGYRGSAVYYGFTIAESDTYFNELTEEWKKQL